MRPIFVGKLRKGIGGCRKTCQKDSRENWVIFIRWKCFWRGWKTLFPHELSLSERADDGRIKTAVSGNHTDKMIDNEKNDRGLGTVEAEYEKTA